MDIKIIEGEFSVLKLKDFTEADLSAPFTFAAKTDEEYSLVCPTEKAPKNYIEWDKGWRAFRIQGVLDFSLIGILSRISTILAENEIGIFAVSTYNTDYVLTKAENFEKAVRVLKEKGYNVV